MGNAIFFAVAVAFAFITGTLSAERNVVHDCELLGKFMLKDRVYECKPVRPPLPADLAPAKAAFEKEKAAQQPKEKDAESKGPGRALAEAVRSAVEQIPK